MELFRRAVESATSCLRIDWRNQKALFRRATAYEKLRQPQQALADLDTILKGDPSHAEARLAQTRLQKTMQTKPEDAAPSGSSTIVGTLSNDDARLATVGSGSTAWFEGLSPAERYKWFVDCYRLRLDDDFVNDSPVRGLYTPGAKRGAILEDWLVFSKLATDREILPLDWNWHTALDVAAGCLSKSLIKGAPCSSTGKHESMREMASLIYGDGNDLELTAEQVTKSLRSHDPHLFDDVGGSSAWHSLLRKLPEPETQ